MVNNKLSSTILLVEDDREIRDAMKGFLEELGCDVALAFDEEDSLRVMNGDPVNIHLIVLNQKMSSDNSLAVGRRLREHENVVTSAPVIVLPFEFMKDREGTDQNVGGRDFKCYMTSEEQLENLIKGLLSN